MKQANLSRREFIKTTGLLTASSLCLHWSAMPASSQKPNILCITCEDIGPFLGCFGDKIARTPNLDRLASEGIKFTNLFSCSGVCAPSRFALITGMYPSACGANNMRTSSYVPEGIPPYEAVPPPQVKCVSEYLRANGYYCTNNEKTDYQFKVPITAWDECSRYAHWRHRPHGMPFFSIFNLTTTHESQVWDRANDPVTIRPEDVQVPPYYPDTPIIRRDIARVYNNITIMDREVGELIDEVQKEGLVEETIVIFYSDNGGPLPRGKRELYDTGLHVPMIIRFPDKKYAGTEVDDLISFVDIPPTIMSLAGIQPPNDLHGRAFWGPYRSEPREYIFGARDRMDSEVDVRRAVRDKRFKYIRNYRPDIGCYQDIQFRKRLASMQELLRLRDEGKLNHEQMVWFRQTKAPEELYDLLTDPYELNNIADAPAYRQELVRLRKVHENWLEEVGDQPLRGEKELVWSMWPGGMQPKTAQPECVRNGSSVEMTSATPGASIAYQLNGKAYDRDQWLLYTKPVIIKPGDKITATAIRIGFRQSETVAFLFE